MILQSGYSTLAAALLVLAVSGCTGMRPFQQQQADQTPVVFQGNPTIEQIAQVVNNNTDRVRQMQSSGATLAVEGLPALQTMLALERPNRFRLQAGLRLTGGNELDLGSNDQQFWFWAKRNQPQAVYFANHQEFQAGSQNTLLPLSPQWLIEALGLIRMEPGHQHTGPYAHAAGRLQVRTQIPQAGGNLTRILVLDSQRGSILEQYVYDQTGTLLASAIGSRHQYEPTAGVSLPREVSIQLPPAQLAFTIRTDGYLINQLEASDQLWTRPEISGSPTVDLMRMGNGLLGAAPVNPTPPQALSRQPNPLRSIRGQNRRSRREWLKSIWPGR